MHRTSLVLLSIAVAGCAAPRVATDRHSGPENAVPCGGPRWSSPVTRYDLGQAAPAVAVDGTDAVPGERLVAVTHRTQYSQGLVEAAIERSKDGGLTWTAVPRDELDCTSSDTGEGGELGPEANDCIGRKQIRLAHDVRSAGRFRLVVRAAAGEGARTGRARLQIVASHCRGMDVCWGASGNNCDGAPTSNCVETEAGMLACPTSIGSQAHDSCCSRWGARGYVCGQCGSAVNPLTNLEQCLTTTPPHSLPRRLLHHASGSFPGGYIPCRAEWDMAFWDVASFPQRLAMIDFDPLDVTYRPMEVTRLEVMRGKAVGVPLQGARLLPAGARLRRVDAELGWCASKRWFETEPGLAQCE